MIEEKYGFNKTTQATFICDNLKQLIISSILVSIIIPLLLYIVDVAGSSLVPALTSVSLALILVFNILVPLVLIPCFYTYSDLPEEHEQLKQAIFKEAEKTKVAVGQIKVIDGSKRSSHSNAFVSGFSRWRKVVLFDTLLTSQETSEILAVVNHELGHVAHHHIVWNMASAMA